MRALEREILAALAARADPDSVLERLRLLQSTRAARGQEDRFLAFWEECRAVTGPEVISRHGYQKPLVEHDLDAALGEVAELVAAVESDGSQAVFISGSLLGLVRDGGPIAYDDDMDLAVVLPEDDLPPRRRAAQWAQLRDRLLESGWIDPEYEQRGRLHARMFTSRGVAVDLFPAWVDQQRAFVFPHTFGTLDASALRPAGRLHGLPVPADPESLLVSNYGPGWRVPDPVWTFDWKAARARFGAVASAWADLVAARRNGSDRRARRLVLHCGALKTGSTAVQATLHAAREELMDAGVLYPESGLMLHEPDAGLRHNRLLYAWSPDRSEFDRTVDALVEEITTRDPDTVVLSAESWSRPQFRPQLRAVVRALRRRAGCREVEAVIVLRNRQAQARSLYREYTARRRNALSCDDFLASERGWFDPVDSLTNLHEVADTVTVLPYTGSDTAVRVLDRLGIPVALRGPQEPANLSLDAVEIEARRLVNRLALRARHLWPGLDETDRELLHPTGDGPPVEHIDPVPYQVDAQWRADLARLAGWSADQVDALLAWSPETGPDVADLAEPIAAAVRHWAASSLVETRVFERARTADLAGTGVDVRLRRIRTDVGPDGVQVDGVAVGMPTGTVLTLDVEGERVVVPTGVAPGQDGAHGFAVALPAGAPSAAVHLEDASGRLLVGRLRRVWQPAEADVASR